MLCAAHPLSPAGETGLDSFGLMDVGAASGGLGLTELLPREKERDPGEGNPLSHCWEQGCSQLSSPRTAVILVFKAFLSSCCCFVTLTCSLCAMAWGETTCREHKFVNQGLVLSDLVAENND